MEMERDTVKKDGNGKRHGEERWKWTQETGSIEEGTDRGKQITTRDRLVETNMEEKHEALVWQSETKMEMMIKRDLERDSSRKRPMAEGRRMRWKVKGREVDWSLSKVTKCLLS